MNMPNLLHLSQARARLLVSPARDVDSQGTWLFWSKAPSPSLQQSIAHHGQLMPILVDASGPKPVLIAGATRLQVLVTLDKDVLCLDLGEQTAWNRGLIYLASNNQDNVDDIRLIQALRFFYTLDADRLSEVFVALNIDLRSRQAKLALTWLALPKAWDKLLFSGHIPLSCATLLRGFDQEDLSALFPLFTTWSWSRSGVAHALTWIREIMIRDGQKAMHVLDAMDYQQIVDAQLSPKDAMTKISLGLWRMRFPHLAALEEKFSEAAKNITAQTRWQLSQVDQFETNFVDLKARVSSQGQLQQAIFELETIGSNAIWDELFEVEK